MFTNQNTDAFLEGLAILGTGGGGESEWGKAIFDNDLEKGRSATIVNLEEVPDDAMIASGGYMGSVKDLSKKSPQEIVEGWETCFELEKAFDLQAKTVGRKIDFLAVCEMGGLNTPVILTLGARTGIPVIDGDGLGRASPETHLSSFIGHGISLTPMTLVDVMGNEVVVHHGKENTFADQLGRWVITHGGGSGANCHYPMSGKKMKESIIPNTISGALALGETVIKARNEKKNVVEVVADFVKGKHIHTGSIQKMEESEWEGFYFTRVELSGGVNLVIKNESMVLYMYGKPVTIFPDFILMLDPHNGRGLMSADLKEGDEIAFVVAACHPRLREASFSPEGRMAFSPARYGQPDLVYHPVEELI